MVGNKGTLSGASTRSEALKSGTKNGIIPNKLGEQRRERTASIFEQVYTVKKNTEAERREAAQQQQVQSNLFAAVQQGDKNATINLLHQLEPTINAAITNMVGGDQRYKTRARLMALDAVRSYDPNQGAELSTYVYNRLQGLRRLAADRGNFIHVPERSALERRRLEEIKNDYMLESGAEPSLAELADRSGMPVRKVGRLMSIFGTTSTSVTRGEHGDSLESKPRTAVELYNDAFYSELPEIDKKIYEWSTGYLGSPQLDRATMAKRLGISEAAISQHAKRIDQQASAFNRTVENTIYGSGYPDE